MLWFAPQRIDMGFIVWAALSFIGFAASYLAACALLPSRSTLERLIATILLWVSARLVAMQALGYAGLLWPWPLACASLTVDGVLAGLSLWRLPRNERRRLVQHDLSAPWRVVRDLPRAFDPSVFTIVLGLGMLVIMAVTAWYFREWTWDGLWYHTPITHFTVQNGTLAWIDSDDNYVRGYPRNVELLAAWNCLFSRQMRLDDSAQFLFGVLGSLVTAAWARRAGAERPLALGVGAAWLALPPVYLELPTSLIDVACGSLFVTAAYFATGKTEPRDVFFTAVAFGLYVGSKFSGLFHLALLSPWVAFAIARRFVKDPSARWGLVLWSLAGAVVAAAVGLPKYVQNAMVMGNPLWPFRTNVPHFGMLPGPEFVNKMYDAPEDARLSFFGLPGDFERMLASWGFVWDHGVFTPDVRSGGFGAVFRWLLVPCVVIVAADVLRGRNLARSAPVVALFLLALVVPAAYWPRYTFGAAVAGLVAFAIVSTHARRRWMRLLLGTAFFALVALDVWRVRPGVYQSPFPSLYAEARAATPADRESIPFGASWSREAAHAREHELVAGDVVAYDESTLFLGEFFTRDYRARVVYVPSESAPSTYLARLRSAHARWAGVRRGSRSAALLLQSGARFLFPTSDDADVYDVSAIRAAQPPSR